jgi:hypothetical protein
MPRHQLLAAGILEERQLREVLAERSSPHPNARNRLMNLAISYTRNQLRKTDDHEIRHPLATQHTYLTLVDESGAQTCARSDCHEPAVPGGIYCGNACRQAAYRERHSTGLQ